MQIIDLIMPSDEDTEMLVLGAMLLEPQAAYMAVNLLREDSIYTPALKMIFKAMSEVLEKGDPIDISTITRQLRKTGQLQEVGGAIFISKLTDRVASTANIEAWLRGLEETAIKRRMIEACHKAMQDALDPMKDIFEVCDEHGDRYVELGHVEPNRINLLPINRAKIALEKLETAMKSGAQTGICVGIDAIDRPTGGFQTGLWILGARPGAGKTELATYIGHTASAQGNPVYFAQIEMSESQSTNRELSMYSGVPYSKITKAVSVNYEEFEKIANTIGKFEGLPFYLDSCPGIRVSKLISKIKFYYKRYGIKMAIIDYLQIMDIPTPKGGNRDQAIGVVTRKLKALANELDIPVLLLCGLNRYTDTIKPFPRPDKSCLRESGNIEADADVIIFLYHAEDYRHLYTKGFEDENGVPLDGVLEVIYDKNRYGKPNTSEYCRWKRGHLQYENMQHSNQPNNPHPDSFIRPRNFSDPF